MPADDPDHPHASPPRPDRVVMEQPVSLPALIGEIVMISGQLEQLTEVLFSNVLDVPGYAGKRVVAGQNFSWTLDRLAVLADIDEDREYATRLLTWVGAARNAYAGRNSVVHGAWAETSGDSLGYLMSARTRGGRYKNDSRDLTRQDLEEIRDALVRVLDEWPHMIRPPGRGPKDFVGPGPTPFRP